MFQRILIQNLSRSRSFCLLGAKGVGKTTLIRNFAGKFSNWIHLDLETATDRAIFQPDVTGEEILHAISFLKGKDIRGNGTLIVLDEIGNCPGAMVWASGQADEKRTGGHRDTGTQGPFIVALSSYRTAEITRLTHPESGIFEAVFLHPFSFEEFLMTLDDAPALQSFREIPVPGYAYEKLLNYFHLFALIGGMPEIAAEFAINRHLTGLKNIYMSIEERFIKDLTYVTAGSKSLALAIEVLQNTYPFAAMRISYSRFGNLEKGSREISQAFRALEKLFFLQLIPPVTSVRLPATPDISRFPRLHLIDTGMVNHFSGIQKQLYQSHDMNAIFKGQIARQAVGQEIMAAEKKLLPSFAEQDVPEDAIQPTLKFWIRNKAQSTAEVDFVIPFRDMLIPVVVKAGEPGRLRSLHQFVDVSPHAFAVRLYAGKLAIQQTTTIRGKKFYLLNLPYFLAGKIREHLEGFVKLAGGIKVAK